MSLGVDILANILDLRNLGIRSIICSAEQCFPLSAIIDPATRPCQMVVDWSCLARMPDSSDYRELLVLWHMDQVHREPVLSGVKASAGTDLGLLMSFSRRGLICLRTSDSFGYFRTQVSTSLANWLVEYCSVCINGDFRSPVLIALVSNRD